mgnify:CR=1 FL=1
MSHGELLVKIEKLRRKMVDLMNKGEDYNKVLQASQELDKYIALYQRIIL